VTDERRFYEAPASGAQRSAPAALRNREPIAEVLAEWLPASGLVLEVASGTGEHAVYFAERFPELDWQPTDLHREALSSIGAWRKAAGLPNVREPLLLDAAADVWPIERADAVLSINMVHISPWNSALGLIAGAARVLPPGAPLILYGPCSKPTSRLPRATLRSMPTCERAIPSGVCGGLRISPRPLAHPSTWRISARCRRTI